MPEGIGKFGEWSLESALHKNDENKPGNCDCDDYSGDVYRLLPDTDVQ